MLRIVFIYYFLQLTNRILISRLNICFLYHLRKNDLQNPFGGRKKKRKDGIKGTRL